VAADSSLHEQKKIQPLETPCNTGTSTKAPLYFGLLSHLSVESGYPRAGHTQPSPWDPSPLGCNGHRIHNTHSSPLVTLCSRSHVDHRPTFISTSKTSLCPNILAWWLHQLVPPKGQALMPPDCLTRNHDQPIFSQLFLFRFDRPSNRG
jgi:hypothetical protein